MVNGANLSRLGNQIKGNGIKEVRTIGTLEQSELHTVGAIMVVSRTPSHPCDDMRRAQIQPHPSEGAVIGGIE